MRPVDSSQPGWSETLAQAAAGLELLNRDTEREFAAIGGRLADFMRTANLISADLADLGSSISGDRALATSRALRSALELSDRMNVRAGETNRQLDKMRREAAHLKLALASSSGTVASFQCLGILTRIETARLGGASADFGSLAEDVKFLTRNIQTKVESALETAADLIPRVETALRDASAIQKEQMRDLPSVISKALASLASFDEMQERGRAASARLEAQSGEIANAFRRLIISIQFQDITRQQVEHVIGVLGRLRAESGAQSSGDSPDRPPVAMVLQLQSLQLGGASEKFASSAATIAAALTDIATNVRNMGGESAGISSLSGSGRQASIVLLERECDGILTSLSRCAAAGGATRATAGRLSDAVIRMSESIEQIRSIEIEMQKIAMNSRISAGALGESGKALSALADAMKELVFESQSGTRVLVQTLGAMSEATAQLCEQTPEAEAEQQALDGHMRSMRASFSELHASSDRSVEQIARVAGCSSRLCQDLAGLLLNFSIGTLFAESIGHVRGLLARIGEESRALSGGGGPPADVDFSEFAARYTMDAERVIHGRLAGTGNEVVASIQPQVEAGDNIEFF